MQRFLHSFYRFSPFAGVGGDFADFFELPDGQAGLYVGDVVGKGLPAALYAALVMGMLRGLHKTGADTATSLGAIEQAHARAPRGWALCRDAFRAV